MLIKSFWLLPLLGLPAPYATESATRHSHVTRWPAGKMPTAPAGFAVPEYAGRFDSPRWLYVAPNGDVLVAESTTIPTTIKKVAADLKLDPSQSLKPTSTNRIRLLRSTNNDGRSEIRTALLKGLNHSLGMLAQLVRAVWPIAREQLRRTIRNREVRFSCSWSSSSLLFSILTQMRNNRSSAYTIPSNAPQLEPIWKARRSSRRRRAPRLDDLRRVGHALIPWH